MRKPPLVQALNAATSADIAGLLDEVAVGNSSGVVTSSKSRSEEGPELLSPTELSLSADLLTAPSMCAELEAPENESLLGPSASRFLVLGAPL